MDITDIPLFQMLRGRLGYLSERQRLIAQNVANAETPGYRPNDLTPFNFDARVKQAQAAGGLAVTQPGHLSLGGQAQGGANAVPGMRLKAKRTPDSETTLDGNQVVLEEEMLKMSDARMNYDAAIGFYQKSLNLLRMAARAPGR
ncbi:MAG TPA: flagellar basal body rod protein FlgB [Phenylobacterium sp.]|nr:flagellar basal body rod protein FlgB [Phenylobacterium sp.]